MSDAEKRMERYGAEAIRLAHLVASGEPFLFALKDELGLRGCDDEVLHLSSTICRLSDANQSMQAIESANFCTVLQAMIVEEADFEEIMATLRSNKKKYLENMRKQ